MAKYLCAALLLLGAASTVCAMPILSADGSLLSGVNVDGALYDVTFGDGIVGEVYSDIVFDAEHQTLAIAVSTAIRISLNRLDPVPGVTAISGCEQLTQCLLFNPENRMTIGLDFGDLHSSFSSSFAAAGNPTIWRSANGFNGFQSASNTQLSPAITLVTFKPASIVSTPNSLAIMGLGLVLLRFRQRSGID